MGSEITTRDIAKLTDDEKPKLGNFTTISLNRTARKRRRAVRREIDREEHEYERPT